MGLTAALNIAQSAVASASAQASVLSQNIANVSTSGYALQTANVETTFNGSSTVASVTNAANSALQSNLLSAQADSSAAAALSSGLSTIQNSLGLSSTAATSTTASTATDQSPSTMLSNLTDALQTYASAPDTTANGTAVVTAAKAMVQSLNTGAAAVQTVREQADSQMSSSVSTINSLLAQFQTVNSQIVSGTASGANISAAQDTANSILSQLSNQIGITTSTTSNGGTTISTDSGVTLFNDTARTVAFTPTSTYSASTTGNQVTVDGIPITGSTSTMAVQSGALAGLSQLRDTAAPKYQNQLDQIASSLITTFADTPSSSSLPSLAGLFTNGGSETLPTSATGLASSISVNASVDPSQGGNVDLLRDGNSSGGNATYGTTAYTSNTGGDAAYSGLLDSYTTALSTSQTFDSSSGGIANGTLANYASSSVSSLESDYKTASNAATYQSSVVTTATTALSNATGVNLDDQMSQMLVIEQAYQASAQLLTTVNSMYSSLITAVQSGA
ncbi:MAG: flagellar hook-associated protein FlgK [Beijerinckiaceae bacterium]|nr:flagellar hook-associated protein FlgK [Beijerinckiaceae bacterium]